jgi:hypothetical protein
MSFGYVGRKGGEVVKYVRERDGVTGIIVVEGIALA